MSQVMRQKKEYAVRIDLGKTHCCVGVGDNQGNAQIIEVGGRKTMPSIVFYKEATKIVGWKADYYLRMMPKQCCFGNYQLFFTVGLTFNINSQTFD